MGAALLLGGALFVFGGCASGTGPVARPAGDAGRSPASASFVIPGVPFLPQEEETCGPSSLAMLLRFYETGATVGELVRETRTPGLAGTFITDLAAAARRRGFSAEIEPLDLPRLEKRIRTGTPVILLVDLGAWVLSRPHYLLAYGVTADGIVAHSGRTAGKVIPFGTLDAQWAKMGRLALVVTRNRR